MARKKCNLNKVIKKRLESKILFKQVSECEMEQYFIHLKVVHLVKLIGKGSEVRSRAAHLRLT